MTCHVCHVDTSEGVAFCVECFSDASATALMSAAKHGELTGPRSHVTACCNLARCRQAEAEVHRVMPGSDVRARWRRMMAAERMAGAYALAELLCTLSAPRDGRGPWDDLDGRPSAVERQGAGS